MIGPRQHRATADRLDRLDDAGVVGRDQHRPDVGLHGAPPDMDDHRLAVDVGERLAGQARRGHAGGDENDRDWASDRFGTRAAKKGCGAALIRVAKSDAKRLIRISDGGFERPADRRSDRG